MFSYKVDQTGLVQTEWVLDESNNETGIVKVILNSPPVNTLSMPLMDAATKTLTDLRNNPKCLACVFLSSLHGRAKTTKKPIFSPGFDLTVFAKVTSFDDCTILIIILPVSVILRALPISVTRKKS